MGLDDHLPPPRAGRVSLRSDAWLDPTERYRYTLSRIWDEATLPVLWIMLNPSTADAERDDPTIRKCMAFSRSWGAGGIVVVNLFAWRATKPGELRRVEDPVGPENNEALVRAAHPGQSKLVIAAWGRGGWLHGRHGFVPDLIGRQLHCLGLTKQGFPKHPLYVSGDTKPQVWTR